MRASSHTFRSLAAGFVLSIWLSTAPNVNAITTNSGAVCSAANLTQALLGMTTDQNGIVNNASIPLFVVCTVTTEVTTLPLNGIDIAVQAIFPAAGGSITCIFRSAALGMPGFSSAQVTIDSGVPAGFSPLRGFDSIDGENGAGTLDGSFAGGSNLTLVCALDPGEGIDSIAIM